MPFYRFTEPARQTDYVEFGLAIGIVCEHLKTWGRTITEIRVRANRLTINVDQALTTQDLTHLRLEEG